MSETTKTPEVLDTKSQRGTTQFSSAMERMRDGHQQHHDVYPHTVAEIPGPLLTPVSIHHPYGTPPLQQKETNKSKDLKRPHLQLPMALGRGGRFEEILGTLCWKNRETENAAKRKVDTQQTPATTAETTGTEAPAAPTKKDREEVIGVLIRELLDDNRKSVAEVSKLKGKIADQQLEIEQLKAGAKRLRKKIKTLSAQRIYTNRLEREIEAVRSQLQFSRTSARILRIISRSRSRRLTRWLVGR